LSLSDHGDSPKRWSIPPRRPSRQKEAFVSSGSLSRKERATEHHSLSCPAFFAGLMTRLVTLWGIVLLS
jgi:hypothetical protein